MTEPLFWLGLSLFFVAVSLTAVVIVALPALQAIARAARSVEKLADTLAREFPPTLESIRLTGLEITGLTEDVSEGVQSASQVVKQVDQGLDSARLQARKLQSTTGGIFTGIRVAWKTFTRKPATSESQRRSANRLPGNSRNLHQLRERNIQRLELYSDTNFELEDEDLGESYHSLNQRD
ncbi:hypothetical protein PA905_13640 [Planktothrix agardhii CCAP 1459/11A]|uniref:DUF948 domain-containing protein n=1 Tax=Planktothrix agardhii CCAP 1459/11A TaxID=282420 RepID=A0A4P5ZU67_PLAAG|nr:MULTISPECIES: hypothetical protein [Planktothrix]GDZ93525.1 hypothetical protein PA905_13640 [Planktothrix agardhii CCAP 1459/11A]CAD5947962.1 hypothetical protein NO108_02732 [Planktothrix rubescens]CAH2571070.1 hypothetical protein PRNO82_00461 [Planktothrix rubescens]